MSGFPRKVYIGLLSVYPIGYFNGSLLSNS